MGNSMKHLSMVLMASMVVSFAVGATGKELTFDAAMHKAIYFARTRNYKQALKYFKLAIKADPLAMDPYFNVGNIARHFKDCRDQLLYFQGFVYLATSGQVAGSDAKSARSALNKCKRDPKVGYLTVITDEPNLEVIVDGALVGETPLHDLPLIAGNYTYTIRNPLYYPFSEQVEITAKEHSELHPKLKKKTFYGWLQITTEPKEGVEVTVGDKVLGTTPLKKVKMKTGKYLVKLKLKGYELWQRYVEINKDLTTKLSATLIKHVEPKKLDMDRWKEFKE